PSDSLQRVFHHGEDGQPLQFELVFRVPPGGMGGSLDRGDDDDQADQLSQAESQRSGIWGDRFGTPAAAGSVQFRQRRPSVAAAGWRQPDRRAAFGTGEAGAGDFSGVLRNVEAAGHQQRTVHADSRGTGGGARNLRSGSGGSGDGGGAGSDRYRGLLRGGAG